MCHNNEQKSLFGCSGRKGTLVGFGHAASKACFAQAMCGWMP